MATTQPASTSTSSKPSTSTNIPSQKLKDPDSESHRHLLSETSSLASASSARTSFEKGGDVTPRGPSPTRRSRRGDSTSLRPNGDEDSEQRRNSSTTTTTTVDRSPDEAYRGFRSRAEYLAALQAWAEEQQYLQSSSTTLWGFYGSKTLQEYAAEPGLELGLRRKWRERKERKKSRPVDVGSTV